MMQQWYCSITIKNLIHFSGLQCIGQPIVTQQFFIFSHSMICLMKRVLELINLNKTTNGETFYVTIIELCKLVEVAPWYVYLGLDLLTWPRIDIWAPPFLPPLIFVELCAVESLGAWLFWWLWWLPLEGCLQLITIGQFFECPAPFCSQPAPPTPPQSNA